MQKNLDSKASIPKKTPTTNDSNLKANPATSKFPNSKKNEDTKPKPAKKNKRKLEEEKQAIADWKQVLINDCVNQPYAAMIINKDSVIEQANERCESIFKQETSELINGDVNMLVPPSLRNTHYEHVKSFFKKQLFELSEANFAGYTKNDKEIQLNIGNLLKKLEIDDINHTLTLCYIHELEKDKDQWMILPENPMYIGWISFMFVFIIGTMLYLPFDFIFRQSDDSWFLNYSIYILTIFDMVFNFNCAYIDEDDVITDRYMISYNYLTTQFLIDLQTGIPVELLEGFLSKDLLTIFKLLRSLKLVKQYNALANDQMITLLSKNEVFKNFKMISNKQQFQYEFLLIIISLLVINHQICSIWILISKLQDQYGQTWVKNSGLINGEMQTLSFIGNQLFVYNFDVQKFVEWDPDLHQNTNAMQQIKENPTRIYIDVYLEIMSAFLGYKSIQVFNEIEYQFSFFIMQCGLFFIAQTIGRMSMLLTETFKDNQSQNRVFQVVQSVAGESVLSNSIIDILLKELKQNNDQFQELKHTYLESKIPSNLYLQLQNEQYSSLLSKHRLLKFIPLQFIEKLHKQCKVNTDTKVFEIGNTPTHIFLLIKGKIHRYDNTNAEISDQEQNEVVGFTELSQYIDKNINTKGIHYEDDEEENKKLQDLSKKANMPPKRVKTTRDISVQDSYAIADQGSEQISISFLILEEIIRVDPILFNKIEEYVCKECCTVTNLELNYTKAEMDAFEVRDQVGIIFLNNGSIYKLNKEFKTILHKDESDFEGLNIFDIVKPVDGGKQKEITEYKNGKHLLHLFGKKIETDITINQKSVVVNRKRIQNKKVCNVSIRNDTLFIFFNMVNSIEAFLVNKQKAVKQVVNVVMQEVGKLAGSSYEEKKFNQSLMRDELKGQKMDYLEFKQFLNNLNSRKQAQKKRATTPNKTRNENTRKLQRAPNITNKKVEQKKKEDDDKRKLLQEAMRLLNDDSDADFEVDDEDDDLKRRVCNSKIQIDDNEPDCFI